MQTEEGTDGIVHLLVDTKDAMGANAVNTMAEKVAHLLAEITGGRPYLRILSNLAVHRLARVRVHVTKEVLGGSCCGWVFAGMALPTMIHTELAPIIKVS